MIKFPWRTTGLKRFPIGSWVLSMPIYAGPKFFAVVISQDDEVHLDNFDRTCISHHLHVFEEGQWVEHRLDDDQLWVLRGKVPKDVLESYLLWKIMN